LPALGKTSGQFSEKIRPFLKKFCPIVSFTFLEAFVPKAKLRENKRRKTNFPEILPLLALFAQNCPKFGRKLVWPLYYLFCPFLNYAAKQLAIWQLWEKDDKIGLKGGFIM